jgi:DeoR/GlpR family transcriptional regulator of sugar metabolism
MRVLHHVHDVVVKKRLMLAAAERKYLLVDHGKFGRPALHFLTALDCFDAVLTGSEPEAAVAKALHEAGIRLTVIGKA